MKRTNRALASLALGVAAVGAACRSAHSGASAAAPSPVTASASAGGFAIPASCRTVPGPFPGGNNFGGGGGGENAAPQQLDVAVPDDAALVGAMVQQGTGASSRVNADLQYLTDVIGPRLTGSPALRRAADWTARKLREYGMDSTWVEEWDFSCGWERGPMTLRMLLPQERWLIGMSWAWSPGTNGPSAGEVVFVDARTTAEFRQRFAGKLRGAWVMTAAPLQLFNPDGPPPSAQDSVMRQQALRNAFAQPRDSAELAFRRDRLTLLAAEGVAGLITDASKEHALLNMSGSPSAVYPFPYIVVPHETYTQFQRLVAMNERVRIEANVSNRFTDQPVKGYNTVAEIRGTEHPDEVVLLGAHLDSWDLGTGTTDNGAGSIAVLEAARILKASGVRPKRTIRFVLFGGEEEGLYGSRVYAKMHAAELPKFQAVTVLDNGTGRITGMALQGRNELSDMWTNLLKPVQNLGPLRVRQGNKGGTDHLSFLPYGVPGFNYDQESRGYDHTHHSQTDTFDHAVTDDLKQAATVMAVNAWQLANLPSLLPRNPGAPRPVGP